MGASQFFVESKGISARAAFNAAVEEAQYENGHGGYTGTIAEKSAFHIFSLPEGQDAQEYAEKLIEEEHPKVNDKWGPAGCICIRPGEYLFFGWASD